MKEFPSCFGDNSIQVADSSPYLRNSVSKIPQIQVTSVYRSELNRRPCLITVIWFKTIVGQGLTVSVHGSETSTSLRQHICEVEIKPWLFLKRRGYKRVRAIDLYWDFRDVKFGTGMEPVHGFYVAVVSEKEVLLLLGDMKKEAWKRIEREPSARFEAILLSKQANLVGKKCFLAKAQFCDAGRLHDMVIECDTASNSDLSLVIRIDGKLAVEISKLRWKFRGNRTISVDGIQVEVYWDVHDWLFGNDNTGSNGRSAGTNAVFMFKTCNPSKDDNSQRKSTGTGDYDSCESVWSLFQESSGSQESGFSVILHAWKTD